MFNVIVVEFLRWPGGIVVGDVATAEPSKKARAKAKAKPKTKPGAKAKNKATKSSSGGGPRKHVKTYSTSYTQIQQLPNSWLSEIICLGHFICAAALRYCLAI